MKRVKHSGLGQLSPRQLETTGDFSWTRPDFQGVRLNHVPGVKVKDRRPVDRGLPPHVAELRLDSPSKPVICTIPGVCPICQARRNDLSR